MMAVRILMVLLCLGSIFLFGADSALARQQDEGPVTPQEQGEEPGTLESEEASEEKEAEAAQLTGYN